MHDLNNLPLPFDNETFDEILCQDIIEHFVYIDLLREIYRIMKKGATLTIRVPHFSSPNNHIDPTHKSTFASLTFEFFEAKQNKFFEHRNYYFDFYFERIESTYITFNKTFFYNYFFQWLINLNIFNLGRKIKIFYECTMMCSLFPAENIIVKLKK